MIKIRIHRNSDKHLVFKISPLGRKLISRLEDLDLSQYLNGLLEVATGSLNEATMAKSTGVADMILSLSVTNQTFVCFWPGLPAYVFFPTKFSFPMIVCILYKCLKFVKAFCQKWGKKKLNTAPPPAHFNYSLVSRQVKSSPSRSPPPDPSPPTGSPSPCRSQPMPPSTPLTIGNLRATSPP